MSRLTDIRNFIHDNELIKQREDNHNTLWSNNYIKLAVELLPIHIRLKRVVLRRESKDFYKEIKELINNQLNDQDKWYKFKSYIASFDNLFQGRQIIVHKITANPDELFAVFDAVPKIHNAKLKRASMALTQTPNHRLRIYKIDKAIHIFTHIQNVRLDYEILNSIPILFDYKISTKLQNILKSTFIQETIGNTNEQPTEDYFIALVNDYIGVGVDIEQEMRQKELAKIKQTLDTMSRKNQADYDEQIAQITHRISTLMAEYENELAKRDNITAKKIYHNTPVDLDEILDFISAQKDKITIKDVHETQFKVTMTTPLTNYDEGILVAILANQNHNIQKTINRTNKFILEKVLLERWKLSITTSVKLYLDYASSSIKFTAVHDDDRTHISNPHLERFNCWGNNEAPLRDALNQKDWIATLSLMLAANSNINFGDADVILDTLFSRLRNSTAKIITTPKGETYTFNEIVALRKSETPEEEKAEEEEELLF